MVKTYYNTQKTSMGWIMPPTYLEYLIYKMFFFSNNNRWGRHYTHFCVQRKKHILTCSQKNKRQLKKFGEKKRNNFPRVLDISERDNVRIIYMYLKQYGIKYLKRLGYIRVGLKKNNNIIWKNVFFLMWKYLETHDWHCRVVGKLMHICRFRWMWVCVCCFYNNFVPCHDDITLALPHFLYYRIKWSMYVYVYYIYNYIYNWLIQKKKE